MSNWSAFKRSTTTNLLATTCLWTSLALGMGASKPVKIYSESFGDRTKPAIILNSGAGNAMTDWSEEFCTRLAARGFYVIRYDYRDTGLSQKTDHKAHPYNASDLAEDAFRVLDRYHQDKAVFVGFSMGGQVALVAASQNSQRVRGIVTIASSSDFKPALDAFEGIKATGKLPPSDPAYIAFVLDLLKSKQFDTMAGHLKLWSVLDGQPKDFDKKYYEQLKIIDDKRSTGGQARAAHTMSMKASLQMHAKAVSNIRVPALIIQGKKDPIFPIEHGQDLHKRIPGSELQLWDDFAHALSPRNNSRLIEAIATFLKKHNI